MNKEKCKALKILGFNFIARDMGGRLIAWMNRPVRVINCLEKVIGTVKISYGSDTVVHGDVIDHDENEWIDGIHISMSCFQCSKEDQAHTRMYSYGHFELLENEHEFQEITWKNSPYKIE